MPGWLHRGVDSVIEKWLHHGVDSVIEKWLHHGVDSVIEFVAENYSEQKFCTQ